MLAGVASGGVYKSTDGGATWQPPARRATAWLRSETRVEPRLVQGQRHADLRGDAERHLHLDRRRRQLDAVQRRHHRHHAARLGRRQVPEHLLRGHHRRPVPLDHRRPHLEPDQRGHGAVRAITQFNGIDRSASTPRPRTASSPAGPDLGRVPGQVDLAQGRPTTGCRPTRRSGASNSYINTPGTLLAGTHGGGGKALVLSRRSGPAPPSRRSATPRRSKSPARRSAVDYNGTWAGTPTIEFTYQWQDCTAACADIKDATDVHVRGPGHGPQVPRRRSPPRTTSRPARSSPSEKESDITSASGRQARLAARRRRRHEHRLDQAHAGRPAAARRRCCTAQDWVFNTRSRTA